MEDKNIHKRDVEPLIKNEDKIKEEEKKTDVFPIKTPETDPVKNIAKEDDGLNQAEIIIKTPPLN